MKNESKIRRRVFGIHSLRSHKKLFITAFMAGWIGILTPGYANASSEMEVVLQQRTVTGVISDENGAPIPGVTVLEKGTTNGTVTDMDGHYTIALKQADGILVFSAIGLKKQEITVKNQTTINVTLRQDLVQVDEVVVVGYGTVRKSDLTGSVAKLKSDAFEEEPVTTVSQALQGRVAGVNVTNAGGPGGVMDIRIRGAVSINAGTEPLYVVDGIPLDMGDLGDATNSVEGQLSAMSSINPNDIESIEVLKDASATAIYGARGSNGVILITTKTGQKGDLKVNVDYSYNLSMMAKKLDLMNSTEYAEMAAEAEKYSNKIGSWDIYPYGEGFDTDWQDAVTRVAGSHNMNLGLSGGTDKTLYNFSVNYLDNEGIIRNSFMKRFSTRLNLDFNLSERLKVGVKISGSKQNSAFATATFIGANMRYVLDAPPTIPIKDEFGVYTNTGLITGNNTSNPVGIIDGVRQSNPTYRFLVNAYGEYKITDWLSYKIVAGYDILNNANKLYQPSDVLQGINNHGVATINHGEKYNWNITNQLNFNKEFNKNHRINGVLVYETSKNTTEKSNLKGTDYFTDTFGYDMVQIATNQFITSSAFESTLLSYLGRLNYTLLNRYLFTAAIRYDGASKFGEDNKFGLFPSGAFAWRASKERFIKDLNIFSDLKFRTSYGVVGNQRIGDYMSLNSADVVQYGLPLIVNGLNLSRLGNSDLHWEKTKQFDVGVDMAFFKNRLQITADYYHKRTEDMLLKLAIPATSGFTQLLSNRGGMKSRGYEFSFSSINIDKKLRWTTNFNFSIDRGEVTDLDNEPPILIMGNWNVAGGTTVNDVLGIIKEGDRLNNFWGFVSDGIIQMGDTEKNEYRHLNNDSRRPGDVRYVDLNGDGKLDNADLGIIGNATPDFTFGLTNGFEYNRFSLNFFLQGTYGNDMMNMLNKTILYGLQPNSGKLSSVWYDRWSSTVNPTNEHGGFQFTSRVSNRYLEDASYLRLKSLTFGYNLPKSIVRNVNSLRLYVTATNLFTITKYSGYDPAYGNSDNFVKGFDSGWYPLDRSFMLGIKLTL